MTEPAIQRNNRPMWPGVFGPIAVGLVIIVVVLIWLWLSSSKREEEAPASTPQVSAPAAVTEFLNYLQNNRAEEMMAKDHAYTSDGIRRLAAALESLSERDGVRTADVTQQLAQLRQQADTIQADPRAITHASTIRAAFIGAADLMTALQQQRYPNLNTEVAQVRRAAEAIDPAQLTLEQKERIGAFFTQAGEALRAMGQARS